MVDVSLIKECINVAVRNCSFQKKNNNNNVSVKCSTKPNLEKIDIYEDYDFISDDDLYDEDESFNLGYDVWEVGEVEEEQLSEQENYDFLEKEKKSYADYLYGYNKDMTALQRDGDDFTPNDKPMLLSESEYKNRLKEDINNIKNMFNKTSLINDTVVYRGGFWNPNQKRGDVGKFDSFTSSSFQEGVADSYVEKYDTNYKITIYAPKGTKGICGSEELCDYAGTPEMYLEEHELTFNKGQKYIILSQDDNSKEVEILLYD